MWPFGNKPVSAKLRMPARQTGTMYGMFATVVVGRGVEPLCAAAKARGERHFTGRFGKFACVARGEQTAAGLEFVVSATAAGQDAADFHRELSIVLAERVAAFNAVLKDLQHEADAAAARQHGIEPAPLGPAPSP